MIATSPPAPTDYPAYYQPYLEAVRASSMEEAMHSASEVVHDLLDGLAETHGEHRYAADKWTVKEVLQHMIDAERIFSYRALRFARNDATNLPGFEENDYVPEARVQRRTLVDLLAEHDAVRASTVALFNSFDALGMSRSGTANGKHVTVNALGWIIAGHALHHARIIKDRYLP